MLRSATHFPTRCASKRCTESLRLWCSPGWLGLRCNAPFCTKPCRNGGVCIAPDECLCPSTPSDGSWVGDDCSSPSCAQACIAGGVCTPADLISAHTRHLSAFGRLPAASWSRARSIVLHRASYKWVGVACASATCMSRGSAHACPRTLPVAGASACHRLVDAPTRYPRPRASACLALCLGIPQSLEVRAMYGCNALGS